MKKSFELADLQELLQISVREGHYPKELASVIRENGTLSATQRIEIYQTAYFLRLTESLEEDFTRTKEFLGKKAFASILKDFVQLIPSRFRDLGEFSSSFVEFILDRVPEAHEMAAQDWLEVISFQAETPVALSAEEIKKGIPFRIKKYPSTYCYPMQDHTLVSSIDKDIVKFQKISKKDQCLLDFLKESKSLEEIGIWALGEGFLEAQLEQMLSSWAALEIIYCEAIS